MYGFSKAVIPIAYGHFKSAESVMSMLCSAGQHSQFVPTHKITKMSISFLFREPLMK